MLSHRLAFHGAFFAILASACQNDADTPPVDAAVIDTGTHLDASAHDASRDAGTDASSPGMDADMDDAGLVDSGMPSTTLGTVERPTEMLIPDSHSGASPLVIFLHGYTGDGESLNWYFNIIENARTRGVYVMLPDGTLDGDGFHYWNATSFCCGTEPRDADDESYLRNLVHEAIDRFPIDPTRVYFAGHSNGSFMSLRMACRMSDEVAAIAGFAGSDAPSAMPCVPSAPVSVMHIHDTNDEAILYEGAGANYYPGAEELVDRWAAFNECTPGRVSSGANIDLTPDVAGSETERFHYNGCPTGIDVVLYKMVDGTHSASFQPTAWGDILDWLTSHHR